jgi:tripartite-type tricarboxylate transporter receptor subunit TctC
MNPAVINAVFGAKLKIIDGYKGSGDLTIALERGEIGGMSATWSNLIGNHPSWLSEGKVRPIVQIGMKRLPAYDKVPLLQDLGRSPEERELIELMPLLTTAIGYSVIAPPGVPDDIVAALRTAFDATMKDPAFVADAGKRSAEIEPADHRAITASVARGIQAPKAQLERFTALIRAK